tara:strand:- start:55 stop:711 length:657 start_codon:yes stop_codon:yes gene_type:complete
MIKGVFFDLDGTLIRSMYFHYLGWKTVLLKQDVIINKTDFYKKEGTKLNQLLKEFFKENNKNFNVKLIAKLIEKKNNFYIKNNKSTFYPGVINLLKYLKKNNVYTSIVTAGSKKRVLNTLPKNFLNLFNSIITGDDCTRGKPYPDPYLLALKKSKLKKKQCIVLENAPLGIKSANNAGICSVAITNTLHKTNFKEAKYIISSANEFKILINKINEKYS